MARILLVTSEFEPFQSSGINRLTFFKRYLEQQGHFVAVLTTVTSAQGLASQAQIDEKHHLYRAYSLSLLARRILSSRRIKIYQKLSKTGKYDIWIPFAVRKGKSLVKALNMDVVLSSFPDFASLKVAEKIAEVTKTKLITDFRDPPYWIYDNIKSTAKSRYHQMIVEKAISRSQCVLACTTLAKKSLAEHYNINEKITLISNGYDAELIAQLPAYRAENKGIFEIVHIGSFYDDGRDIKPIVKALEGHSTAQKPIKLRLVGDYPDAATIKYINEISKSLVVAIEPPVPIVKALSIAKQADALLLLQGQRFNRQIPAKVYEYLALNRPIWAVVGINGATHDLLKGYSANVVISDYNDENDICLGTKQLLDFEAKVIDSIALSRQAQAAGLQHLF